MATCVVPPTNRAVDDETATNLLGESFRHLSPSSTTRPSPFSSRPLKAGWPGCLAGDRHTAPLHLGRSCRPKPRPHKPRPRTVHPHETGTTRALSNLTLMFYQEDRALDELDTHLQGNSGRPCTVEGLLWLQGLLRGRLIQASVTFTSR